MGGFGKIAVLVAIVAVAWFGWRWFQRWEKERRLAREAEARRARGAEPPGGAPGTAVEELRRCAACDAFVPAPSRACTRADCPFPR